MQQQYANDNLARRQRNNENEAITYVHRCGRLDVDSLYPNKQPIAVCDIHNENLQNELKVHTVCSKQNWRLA